MTLFLLNRSQFEFELAIIIQTSEKWQCIKSMRKESKQKAKKWPCAFIMQCISHSKSRSHQCYLRRWSPQFEIWKKKKKDKRERSIYMGWTTAVNCLHLVCYRVSKAYHWNNDEMFRLTVYRSALFAKITRLFFPALFLSFSLTLYLCYSWHLSVSVMRYDAKSKWYNCETGISAHYPAFQSALF